MARIPEAELERLKQEASLQRLVEAKGVTLERHGADLIGLCPFHNDTSPSLVVSPKKNLWHCLGACQAGGTVIDWVMKAEGVSFRHAVELLRADAPSLAAGHAVAAKQSTVRKLDAVIATDVDDAAAMREVVDFYHASLKESPEALAYLEKRGLHSSEMVAHFRLGFANRTLGYRLPAKNRQTGAALRGRLTRLGILRASGHEHFCGSVVVPIFDEQGVVLGMYGRKVTATLRKGTPDHLYLPGARRGVWNVAALAASEDVILCEALLDALTFWCAGFRNVTSAYGIEGFSKDHLDAFKRYGTKRVLIAYDRDEAGEKAAAELAPKLIATGLECYRVQFPHGMDANEYALAVPPAEKSLRIAVERAVWLGRGKQQVAFVDRESHAPAALAAKELGAEVPSAAAVDSLGTRAIAAELPRVDVALPTSEATPPSTESALEPDTMAAAADELVLRFGARQWRVRGIAKNTSHEVLRVNVQCRQGEAFHLDTLDLYSARHRASFIEQAAREIGTGEPIIKAELGRVLCKLEELQDQLIQAAQQPKDTAPAMSESERAAAMDLLTAPGLLERVLADFEKVGVVGEETNKLVGYIAAVSRKLEAPLAIIIQSSSAAGKSSLMESILAFLPVEERVKYSAMTGQSLFYMGETNLKHKVLAIVEEAGAERAAYALKLLQSEGELTIASTGKDPTSGRLVTHEYRVEGPVMILLTTTAIEIDEELLNRCIVLTVDEEREQTRAIHKLQRESQTLEGLLSRAARSDVLAVHRNAQRLLRPLLVANPFARHLTFCDDRTRTRRDHMKYLTLIRAIALLHQYQRPIKSATKDGRTVQYIEVTREDVAMANKLSHQVLGRSLDELPPQTRRLLTQLDVMATAACAKLGLARRDYRFSRRELREHTGWGLTQVRAHLDRLVALEYVAVHRGLRGQSFVYELAFDGAADNSAPHLSGLIDLEALGGEGKSADGVAATRESRGALTAPGAVADTTTTESWRGSDRGVAGSKVELAGSIRGDGGPLSGGWRGSRNGKASYSRKGLNGTNVAGAEKSLIEEKDAAQSYVPIAVAGAR